MLNLKIKNIYSNIPLVLFFFSFFLVFLSISGFSFFTSYTKFFWITFIILMVLGLFSSIVFSYIIIDWIGIYEKNGKITLKNEHLDSLDNLQNLENKLNSYRILKEERKKSWNENIAKTSKIHETIFFNIEELSKELSSINKLLENQSGKIEKMTDSLSEMSLAVKSVVSHAEEAVTTSSASENDAKRGGEIVSQIIKHMNKITETVSRSAAVIQELGKRSNEIVDIINVIDDIADQTDLLALNAAIEAARAGAQGRGFAVVADQVRSLSEKTSHATKEIAATLSSIQAKTSDAVVAMQEGLREIDIGAGFAVQAGVSLRKIVSGAKKVTDMVSSIAKATEKQSQISSTNSDLAKDISQGFNNTWNESKSMISQAENLKEKNEKMSKILESFINISLEHCQDEDILSFCNYIKKELEWQNERLEKVCDKS